MTSADEQFANLNQMMEDVPGEGGEGACNAEQQQITHRTEQQMRKKAEGVPKTGLASRLRSGVKKSIETRTKRNEQPAEPRETRGGPRPGSGRPKRGPRRRAGLKSSESKNGRPVIPGNGFALASKASAGTPAEPGE